jgi:hypothetical protein
MKRISWLPNLCCGLIVVLGSCGSNEVVGPTGPFRLTIDGDASFQGPHGGQSIAVVVVRTSDGAVVAGEAGTVSASADPAFSFTFTGLLVVGVAYEVHYWIDSNLGGGTEGVCDPEANDHQWIVAIAAVEGDVTITEAHNAANTGDVCDTFTTDLTFALDASFQGPHGGHPISVAVLRTGDGAVVARQIGTVSASEDPAFSSAFPGLLVVGVAYQVHYWIDSNFGGGSVGVCDPKENDHQWSVDVPAVQGDVAITEAHNDATTMDVCPTFSSNWRANEPAGYAAIVGRGFNSKASDDADRGTGEFPYKSGGSEGWDGVEQRAGRFTIIEDATAPVSPANVAQLEYTEGMNGGSAPATLQTQWFPTVHGVNYQELYVSYAFKISDDFHGHRTSTNKLFHYWVASTNRIFGRLVGTDDGPLQYQIGLQGSAPPCETRSRLVPNQGESGVLSRGEWYEMELQFVLNTTGMCDGIFRVWVNGTKIIEYTDVGILQRGEGNSVFNQVQLSTTWGGGGDVAPHSFFLWVDEVYASGTQ